MDKAAIRGAIATCLLCICTTVTYATTPPILDFKAVEIMDRVPQSGKIAGTDRVHIYAARNETEPFQVVVSASRNEDLWDVEIELEKLTGPGEATITTISLYRQHYVSVTTPSLHSPFQAQSYPDALIPFTHPQNGVELNGQVYDAVPFDLAEGGNQPIWIDIQIPPDVPAGEYHGTIRVAEQGLWVASLPITLTVWDFNLPDVPAMGSDFGLNDVRVAQIYGLDRNRDEAIVNPIVRRYYDLLLDHLLSPSLFADTSPAIDPVTGKPDFSRIHPGLGTAAEGLAYYLDERHAASYGYALWKNDPFGDPLDRDRERVLNYLADYSLFLKKNGWSKRAHMPYGFLDEPDSEKSYAAIRDWGVLSQQVEQRTGIPIPLMVTEQPEPQNPKWGSLHGFVDIWVPHFNAVMLDMQRNNPAIPARLDAGDQMWSYTALSYVPGKSTGELLDAHPPKWLIDFAPINYRIPAWLNALHGISGLLYWNTLWWDEGIDVWKQAGNYSHQDKSDVKNLGEISNGEGLLIYPGLHSQIGFDGPVASIRLKWLRESIEDFSYIQLLRDNGEWQFARQQINTFAWSMTNWKNNPQALYRARQAMGEKLEQIFRDKKGKKTDVLTDRFSHPLLRLWLR